MAEIPEGATTASSEGADLVSAIEGVAKELEIAPEEVAYKLDLSHFRTGMGVSVAKRTVKIIGWKGEKAKPLPKAANASSGGRSDDRPRRDDREDRPRREAREDRPRREAREDRPRREDREDKGRGERRERKARSQEPMEGEPTEASKFAVEWFSTLLGYMDVKGTVNGIGNDERVRVSIEADKAGRIIGKRGSTLRAIRTVLGSALKNNFGDLIIDVDVADNRDESERPERRERNDRDDRGGRGRGGRSDRGGRGDRGDRGGAASSAHPQAKLEALAKRAGEKAVETNKTITINLELNSYDRRIVHMAIAEIDGVDSRSEERDGKKFVQVMPAAE